MANWWESDPVVPAQQGQGADKPYWEADQAAAGEASGGKATAPPPPERSLPERIVRGVTIPIEYFNKGMGDAIGAIPNLVLRGTNALGLTDANPRAVSDAATRFVEGTNTGAPGAGVIPQAEPETATERVLAAGGRGAGQAAGTAFQGGLAASANIPGAVGAGINTAGRFVAAQPGVQMTSGAVGGATEEATGSPTAGFLASLATPFGLAAARRLIQPVTNTLSPELQRLVNVARDRYDIPLTAGERTGSTPLKLMEGSFEQLPLTAETQAGIKRAEQEAFTRGSLSHSGTTADAATSDVLTAARDRIGTQIGDIANRNALDLRVQVPSNAAQGGTTSIVQELADIGRRAQTLSTDEVGRPVMGRIRELLSRVDPQTGTIPGSYYRQLDSELGRTIRSTSNGDLRAALGDLRDTLRAGMDASISPADQAAWQEARRQYANLMVSARAVGGAGAAAAEGQIPPKALRAAVDQSTGRGYAMGRGDQNDLARIGQSIMAPPVGDSGTAARSSMMRLLQGEGAATSGALGGLAAGAPGAAAATAASTVGKLALPRMIQSVYNRPFVQEYLAAERPDWLLNLIGRQPSSLIGNVNREALTRGAVMAGRLLQ